MQCHLSPVPLFTPPPPSFIITVPMLSAQQRSTPALSFWYPYIVPPCVFQHKCQIMCNHCDLRPKPISSPHTDAAKNPRTVKMALGTTYVKNDYKSTCSVCRQTDTPPNRTRNVLGPDADNNHTDRQGDAGDEWGETWSLTGSMGADAAS